MKNKMLSQTYR